MSKKDSDNIIDFEHKRRSRPPEYWKIQYQIQKKSKSKKRFPKEDVLFWMKFCAYLLLVTFGMKQCGFF